MHLSSSAIKLRRKILKRNKAMIFKQITHTVFKRALTAKSAKKRSVCQAVKRWHLIQKLLYATHRPLL